MITIKVPQNLSLTNALNFCNRLWELEDSEMYEIDFKNLGNVEPFTMAYVANELKRFRQSKAGSKFKAKNHEDKSYAAHMGFFRAFGLKFGNEPGEAKGSSTYIPLTILNVSDLNDEASENYANVGDMIRTSS
ncbi:hypothetical protein AB4211_05205, partial [Vibrio lentus]